MDLATRAKRRVGARSCGSLVSLCVVALAGCSKDGTGAAAAAGTGGGAAGSPSVTAGGTAGSVAGSGGSAGANGGNAGSAGTSTQPMEEAGAGGAASEPPVGAPDYGSITALQGSDQERCTALAAVVPADTVVDSATWQGSYCQVRATQKPSPDSIVHIEVRLPAKAQWNGKLQGTGNGGFAGQVNGGALDGPVSRGYAAANSDLGTGNAESDVIGHPERIADWGNRATHWMTLASKHLLFAFYGKAPDRSYFVGCSTGGQQALVETQRFPNDYDGVIAGAPVTNRTRLHESFVWSYSAFNLNVAAKMTAPKLALLNGAAVAKCDALDGVVDGLIRDGRSCNFDPSELSCPGADAPTCLTAAQVEAVKKAYAGMTNPKTLELLAPGWPRGSEHVWGGYITGAEPPYAAIQRWVFGAAWDWKSYDFDASVKEVDEKLGGVVNAIDPDLSAFQAHGARLIIWHGWSDAIVNPFDTVSYFERVAAKLGAETPGVVRLFMAPGVDHCGGGPGPGGFDLESALQKWVESNAAPDQIVANGGGKSRPLCPHPQLAKYNGAGDSNVAASFTCVAAGPTGVP